MEHIMNRIKIQALEPVNILAFLVTARYEKVSTNISLETSLIVAVCRVY